jgi:amidase
VQKPIESRTHAFPKAWVPLFFSLTWLLSGCAPDPVTSEAPFELQGISITAMQDKLNSGKYTSVQIAELYLNRINTIDQNGIALHAVIELNPDALAIAAERDIERLQGHIRGPLHGIPILIKDNIETGDRMQTTSGSLALVGNRAKRDAFVVEQLRAQGAIILGKTNMTEWSNFRASDAISGWSSRGGQVKNPYILSISPCGSSSGSAAAVAADLCMVAVGTSTNGSIACPASFNGMVGIRPISRVLSVDPFLMQLFSSVH